jgi:hypothetical protein
MMRILFCNIAWMKEYRGNEDGKDIPLNGGSYVDETGDAHEKYNFTPVNMEGREGLYCLGFFETKSHNPGYWGTSTRGEDNVIADWRRIRK